MSEHSDKLKVLSQRFGLSEDQASEALMAAEEDAKNLPASGTYEPQVPIHIVKAILRRLSESENRTHISAEQLGDELKADGIELESNRHLGDLLGRGPRGLYLESQKGFEGRNKSKTYYKIPDIQEFGEWYESEHAFLPRSYYSDSFFKLLLAKEVSRKNSRLLSM